MKKLLLFFVIIVSMTMFSSRVKKTCELNHSGSISVINNSGETVELRVSGEKIGEIDNGMVRTLENRLVGSYDISVIKYPKVWDTTVNVTECGIVEYTVK